MDRIPVLILAIAAVAVAALSASLAACVADDTARAIAPTMIGVCVAAAIFAVNFSFVAFQLAPYRELLAGPSSRHVASAALLVLVSLVPLTGAVSGRADIGRLGVGVVPLLAYGAVLLVALALREASPQRILGTRASDRALRRFAAQFADAVARQTTEVKHLSTIERRPTEEPRVGPPMHELGHRLPPPPLRDDPLEVCIGTAEAAIARDDAVAFVPAVERLVELSLELRRMTFDVRGDVEGWEIGEATRVHVAAALRRVEAVVVEQDTRTVLVDRFMEAIARTVREQAVKGSPAEEAVVDLFYVAVAACRHQLERRTSGSGTIGVLIAARQASEIGARELDDAMDEYALAGYASGVQVIGTAAIIAGDSETLYRCLEALSWIGCSAVRHGAGESGRRAAGALVQLGREARHADLECHWDRCALTPYQHAEERLRWIATWVPQADHPRTWLSPLGTAFARLHGRERKLELDEENPTDLRLIESDEPYTESYLASEGERTLHYSDESMLKQQALH